MTLNFMTHNFMIHNFVTHDIHDIPSCHDKTHDPTKAPLVCGSLAGSQETCGRFSRPGRLHLSRVFGAKPRPLYVTALNSGRIYSGCLGGGQGLCATFFAPHQVLPKWLRSAKKPSPQALRWCFANARATCWCRPVLRAHHAVPAARKQLPVRAAAAACGVGRNAVRAAWKQLSHMGF